VRIFRGLVDIIPGGDIIPAGTFRESGVKWIDMDPQILAHHPSLTWKTAMGLLTIAVIVVLTV
jgi:hypothetical protein